MSTNPLHTILLTAVTVGLAAVLAVATAHREQSVDPAPAAYGLLQAGHPLTSR